MPMAQNKCPFLGTPACESIWDPILSCFCNDQNNAPFIIFTLSGRDEGRVIYDILFNFLLIFPSALAANSLHFPSTCFFIRNLDWHLVLTSFLISF